MSWKNVFLLLSQPRRELNEVGRDKEISWWTNRTMQSCESCEVDCENKHSQVCMSHKSWCFAFQLGVKALQMSHKRKLPWFGSSGTFWQDEKSKFVALIKMGWTIIREKKRTSRVREENVITEMDLKVYLEPFFPASPCQGEQNKKKANEKENDRFANDRSGMSRRYDNRHPFSNVE